MKLEHQLYTLCLNFSSMKTIGSKNGNMVLQLVLPSGMQNGNNFDNYLSSATSYNDVFSMNNFKRRKNRNSIGGSQQDIYSSVGNGFVNRAYSFGDLSDFHRHVSAESGIQTPGTLRESEFHTYSPTPPEEKKRIFREYLTKILSCVYAVFIVTLGVVVYISDILVGNSPIAETFSLYLVLGAFVFLLYLIIDVRIYMNKKNEYNAILEKNHVDDIELRENFDGDFHLSVSLPEIVKIDKPFPHHYCLSKGRHSGSFYLKIGAAGFCLGHLIHSGLLLGYQIVFLTSDGDTFYECAGVATLFLDFVYPVYSFFLLYFIFKYSNIIINRHVSLVRFGLMHCISSSLCFWVWTILRETIEALSAYDESYEKHEELENAELKANISETNFFTDNNKPIALALTTYSKKGAKKLTTYLNASVRLFSPMCEEDESLSIIYQNYSPYLYPFSVEYSILVVGVLFIIWQSIGTCRAYEETSNTRNCETPGGGNSDNLESNIVIHADCHSANKGLFGGIILLVVSIVSIILFFIAINDERFNKLGLLVNTLTEIFFLLLMTVTVILAYRQTTKLDVNFHYNSLLDDLLLFICIPAFFLNGIFTIVPAIQFKSGLGIAVVTLQVVQVLVQTPLIIDGLRRCSNSRELRKEKPGRELLTFLIVCNVAMWITQTFEIKSHGLQDHRYDFYGKVLWTIIGHMCLPLMMFYRFHSSVCIVDMWKFAYEPAGH